MIHVKLDLVLNVASLIALGGVLVALTRILTRVETLIETLAKQGEDHEGRIRALELKPATARR